MVKNKNGIREFGIGGGRLRLSGMIVLVALFAVAFGAACADDDNSVGSAGELKIGALLDFTGDWQTLGKASKAAIELAEEDINGRAAKEGLPRISVTVKETGLDPKRALEGIKALYDDGVRVVIGPQSSSEVREILPFAKEKGIIVISQGSTSSTLSTGGDTVFRLPPDDRQETAAIAALLKEDGITAIVPAWRADLGNQGLATSVRSAFQAVGGTASAGIEYPTSGADIGKVLDTIEQQVNEAGAKSGAKVGIYLAAFEEAATVLGEAAKRQSLAGIRWYGTSSIALTATLTSDSTASDYAIKAGFPNPSFGLDRSAEGKKTWETIAAKVRAKSGQEADAFALSAYDAVELAALAVKAAGGTGDAQKLGDAIVATAKTMKGLTGSLALNEAGDRAAGSFDFWVVCKEGDKYGWELSASYTPGASGGAGSITRLKGCGG